MKHTIEQMRRDALEIWRSAVDAVKSDRLVAEQVRVDGRRLIIGDTVLDLDRIGRIAVVGAGKAGTGMAEGLEQALGPSIMAEKQVTGWVHVPSDCVRPLARIHLHPARPAGVNEPTAEGVAGSREMLALVRSLKPNDLCIALISGGGSALLPLPVEGISLADKLAVTRFLSAAGAPIEELNTVRKQLSQIKGGNLARACGAGTLVALVISDVLGDPLDLIASGPTVEDRSTPREALEILERYGAETAGVPPAVFAYLRGKETVERQPITCQVTNRIIANIDTAAGAAAEAAKRLGYRPTVRTCKSSEGLANEVGLRLAEAAIAMRDSEDSSHPDCLIHGGEPVVKLSPTEKRGLGGRNQQLVLAAALRLDRDARRIVILSGGTDGEDGPTDAAGAWVDADVILHAAQRGLDPADYLQRNDAYHWFEPLGALIKTGPTHTNVCDIRVVLVDR